jgi:sec-independent protein translocase protein TatA
MPGNIGLPEILVVLVIALIIFGPKRLPELGQSMGRGIREFKNSLSGDKDKDSPEEKRRELEASQATEPATAPPQPTAEPATPPAPTPPAATPPAPPAATPPPATPPAPGTQPGGSPGGTPPDGDVQGKPAETVEGEIVSDNKA